MNQLDQLTSPCIGVCIMDPATQYCHGCYRTLREISSWLLYTPAERCAVLAELERRRADQPEDKPDSQPPLPVCR